jgi:hypothetical protein
MRKLAVRLLLSVAYILAEMLSLLLPFSGPNLAAIWSTIVGLALAFAAVYFTGRATVFVATVTFFVSALLPFLVLCRIGMPAYGTFSASCATVLLHMQHNNILGAFQLVVPVVVATIGAWLLGRPPLTIRSSGPL